MSGVLVGRRKIGGSNATFGPFRRFAPSVLATMASGIGVAVKVDVLVGEGVIVAVGAKVGVRVAVGVHVELRVGVELLMCTVGKAVNVAEAVCEGANVSRTIRVGRG